MSKRSREIIQTLKEELGIVQSKIVKDENSPDCFAEKITDMPQEEAEEYLKLKNAANLGTIKNLLAYIAVILSLPVVAAAAYGLFRLYLLIFY